MATDPKKKKKVNTSKLAYKQTARYSGGKTLTDSEKKQVRTAKKQKKTATEAKAKKRQKTSGYVPKAARAKAKRAKVQKRVNKVRKARTGY